MYRQPVCTIKTQGQEGEKNDEDEDEGKEYQPNTSNKN